VVEPLEERALAASLPTLTPIDDSVSRAVRAMYEENPYPRWLSLNRHTPQTPAALLRTLFPHFSPPAFLDAGVRVLVAGCGTGKHALSVATRFRDADVLALDVSRASLAYAARSARELAVTNVAFRRGDILDLSPEVAGEFQLVECVGVLHHMREPEAGCERLVSVLQTGGVLKLGLYSERARAAVTAARARFARARAGVTPGVVRRFREEVKRRREEGDAEAERLTSFFDFYTLSDCRDLVFHVQEQCFTLPRVAAMLKRFGLRFVGFEFASPSAAGLYRKCFPEDDAMMSLSNWEELERDFPHLFAAMYQFWCQKV
jgi:SAM-dependent methyltransferase